MVLPWPQPWHGDAGDVCLPWQGNLLRKMLMNNYLQNKRSSSKGEMGDAAGGGECPSPAPSLPFLLPHTSNSRLLSRDGSRPVAGCHVPASTGAEDLGR